MLKRISTLLLPMALVAFWPLSGSAQCADGDLTCCVTDSPGAGSCELSAKPGEFPRALTAADCGAISDQCASK